MVAVGLPPDATVLAGAPPIALALKRLNIVGSVTGTLKVRCCIQSRRLSGLIEKLQDVEDCLDFTARGLVHPILTKGTLSDVDKFCGLTIKGELPGRAVLKVAA